MFNVLSLQLKNNESTIDLSNTNPAHGHKDVLRLAGHFIVKPATQTNRDPNRAKIRARANQPSTSETHRCIISPLVIGYEFTCGKVIDEAKPNQIGNTVGKKTWKADRRKRTRK